MFNNTNNVQGHGFIRKSKVYGTVCGIALAGLMFVSNPSVSAEEITTDQSVVPTAASTVEAPVTETTEVSEPVSEVAEAPAEESTETPVASETEAPVNETPTTVETATDELLSTEIPVVSQALPESGTQPTESTVVGSDISDQVTVTGEISTPIINSYNSSTSMTINTTVPTAKSGDYVDYYIDNFQIPDSMNNSDVVTSDGLTIGKLTRISPYPKTGYQIQMGATLEDNIAPQGSEAVWRVIFNDNVNDLQDIRYSFGINNVGESITTVDQDTEMVKSVTVNSKVVLSDTVIIPEQPIDTVNKSFIHIDNDYSYVTINGGEVVDSLLQMYVSVDNGNQIKAGDTMNYTMDSSSDVRIDTDKVHVGNTYTLILKRLRTADNVANDNHVIVYEQELVDVKVVSVTEDSLEVEFLGNVSGDSVRSFTLGNVLKVVASDDMNLNEKKIENIPGTSTFKSETLQIPDWVGVRGTNIDADALNKKGSVILEFRDVNSKDELTNPITTNKDQNVNTNYDVTGSTKKEITDESGRKWRETGTFDGNTKGKVTEGTTTVVQYFEEVKGSVVVDFVDEDGNTIKARVTDTKESSLGGDYDTTDHKTKLILVKNEDGTVTAYSFKEIQKDSASEQGKITEGESVVTYVYKEEAIVPVKDVLNKDGKSIDGDKVQVGEVLTFLLNGAPVTDGIEGGLYQYDLKDLIDTKKLEFIDGSVKVKAGEFANITLPDGKVLKANDDISKYMIIEYKDGLLTIKPTEEFYAILRDNKVDDLVDIDATFDAKIIAEGTVENEFVQIVNGFEFKSNKTTNEAEIPVEPKDDNPITPSTPSTPKANPVEIPEEAPVQSAVLPSTGEATSLLSVFGAALISLAGFLGLKKKEEN